MKWKLWYVALLVGIISLISCTTKGINPELSPLLSQPSMPAMGFQLPDDGRGETALVAYLVAEDEAKRWNREAVLYQIPVTKIMEINLGIPSGIPGWFFLFKVPDSPVEYYIEIVNGRVFGMTEAQPILTQELPYELLPIDVKEMVLDSDDVLQLFMKLGGVKYIEAHPEMQIDYRLVHLKGQPHPIWSLFDISDINRPPLFNVDGVTGDVVEDPFSSLLR
ncbi:MAG: hypothetical protein ACPLYD_12205 [Anaerolineae bacterium]